MEFQPDEVFETDDELLDVIRRNSDDFETITFVLATIVVSRPNGLPIKGSGAHISGVIGDGIRIGHETLEMILNDEKLRRSHIKFKVIPHP